MPNDEFSYTVDIINWIVDTTRNYPCILQWNISYDDDSKLNGKIRLEPTEEFIDWLSIHNIDQCIIRYGSIDPNECYRIQFMNETDFILFKLSWIDN